MSTTPNEKGNMTQKILYDLEKLDKRVEQIDVKIDEIRESIGCLNKSARNMDDHISFVENVYDAVRNPIKSVLQYYYRSPDDQNLIEMKLIKKN